MFLTVLGIAFIIIATYFVYKSALDYGRNAFGWALLTFFGGIAIQWVFPVILMLVLMLYWTLTGSSQGEIQESIFAWSFLISLGSLILSIAALLLILKFVGKMPEEKTFVKPPSPPSF